jgi:glutaredoxin 3
MVCIPCIIIPIVLWLFHKYIQPLILKFWNPWATKGVYETAGGDSSPGGANDSGLGDSKEHQYIQKLITEHPVMVFSKPSCSYCKMAKEVLDGIGVEYQVDEIEGRDNCDALQDAFLKMTGARTVPRVFVGGKCVGGGSETYSLHNQGKLLPLIKEAGAAFKKDK